MTAAAPTISSHLATVTAVVDLSPGLRRVTVAAPSLREFAPTGAGGDAVKVFFPTASRPEPAVPVFTAPGVLAPPAGEPSPMRTLSVAGFRCPPDGPAEIDLDVVRHDGPGIASPWAGRAEPGQRLGLLGPANTFALVPGVHRLLAAADLSALPALLSVLDRLPATASAEVILVEPDPRRLPAAAQELGGASIVPDTASAVELAQSWAADATDVQFWIAGERSLVRELRRIARATGVQRDRLHASGYWRAGWAAERLETHELELFQAGLTAGNEPAQIDLLAE